METRGKSDFVPRPPSCYPPVLPHAGEGVGNFPGTYQVPHAQQHQHQQHTSTTAVPRQHTRSSTCTSTAAALAHGLAQGTTHDAQHPQHSSSSTMHLELRQPSHDTSSTTMHHALGRHRGKHLHLQHQHYGCPKTGESSRCTGAPCWRCPKCRNPVLVATQWLHGAIKEKTPLPF